MFASTWFDEEQLADAYKRFYQPGQQYNAHLIELDAIKMGRLPRLGWNKRRFFRVAPRRLTGLRVLEMGAGAGVFGFACTRKGAGYLGYDISASIVERVRADTDLDIRRGTWRTAVAECAPRSFDFVVAWEAFEHIQDIRDALCALRELLKEDGLLVFSVPNYLRHTYSKPGRLGQDPPPIHVNFWSPVAIRNFLRICGYAICSIDVKPFRELTPNRMARAIVETALSKLGRFHGPTIVVSARRGEVG